MTIAIRVIPCLLLQGSRMVKTVRFRNPTYLGDPRNAVKIFNEREVDELLILDISATPEGKAPQYELLREVVSEAFMPVGYGGGLRNVDDAKRVAGLGVEKMIVSTEAVERPAFVEELANVFGSSSVVVCLDVKRRLFGKYDVVSRGGRKGSGKDPVVLARDLECRGAGEIIVNAVDRDGTMEGYDVPLIRSVASAVAIPVVACGGAGKLSHFAEAVRDGKASAVAAGSMFVFQGKHRAVLINYPARAELEGALGNDSGMAHGAVP